MKTHSRRRLRVEGLESRMLLAGDVSSSCGSIPHTDDGVPAYVAGDANRDGRFDQSDIVAVLSTDKYLRDEPASWSEGDWNADHRFDQLDIVASLQGGDYLSESDPIDPSAAAAVSIRLSADSVGGLAAAITAAGPRGTVVVEAGMHSESSSVVITHPVRIVGEEGAVIEFDSEAATEVPRVIDAGFHIKNTCEVQIQGLEIRDNDGGSTAILIEGSEHVSIEGNRTTDFQFGVLVESADHSTFDGNEIGMSSERLPVTSFGILVVNGFDNQVRGNTVSQHTFGIFASGENGKLLDNAISDNFVGIMFCNLPPTIQLPDADGPSRSAIPAARWLAQGNTSTNNDTVGYLVIDGSNSNTLLSNQGGDNGTYDIELTSLADRFGLEALPASYDNVVNAESHSNVKIKDCGTNNQVFGGDQVDTDVDACP